VRGSVGDAAEGVRDIPPTNRAQRGRPPGSAGGLVLDQDANGA
jgi:hypothetical protein